MDDALSQLLGRSNRPDPGRGDRAAAIADLVRTELGLGPDAAVSVQQLACTEPGCPPIETKILVLAPEPVRRWTLHAPIAEVEDGAVLAVLAALPEGETA